MKSLVTHIAVRRSGSIAIRCCAIGVPWLCSSRAALAAERVFYGAVKILGSQMTVLKSMTPSVIQYCLTGVNLTLTSQVRDVETEGGLEAEAPF